MHSVHDPVIGSEDDRVRRIHLANEAEGLYDLPNRGPLPLIEPVLGVDLREVIKRDLLYRQMSNQSYQVVNVPRIHPALGRPEVVLLPHRLSLAQNIDATGHARFAATATDSAIRAGTGGRLVTFLARAVAASRWALVPAIALAWAACAWRT